MSIETAPAAALQDGPLRTALQWQAAFVQMLLQAQQRQLELFAGWQRSMAAVGQDQWDSWVCRFGGGVPLDG